MRTHRLRVVAARRLFLLALSALAGGCVWSMPEPVLVREPRPEPIPLSIGVYYSSEFQSYTYRHHLTDTAWRLGEPSVRLFDEALALLFTRVVRSEAPREIPSTAEGVAAVIEPSIVSTGYTYPTSAGTPPPLRDKGCFPLHVTYRFVLRSTRGESLATWETGGRDCAPVRNPLGAVATIKQSFEQVMREAAWKLTSEFRAVPGVRRWLDQQGVRG